MLYFSNSHKGSEYEVMVIEPTILSEAQRVYDFKAAAESTSDLTALGKLMNASHKSCSQLYDCSHPAVDTLVELALKHGAFGAR